MKKILFLLLASFLVLDACGNEEESKADDKKETKSSDKESKKDDKEKESDKEKSYDDSNEGVAKPDKNANQLQEQINTQEQQNTKQSVQSQEQQRREIDLNRLPGGDFTTEGMSKDAQMQIEELTRQKDFEGLPQKEYNDQVSAIMNSEMN
ncbi:MULTISPECIES: hypothetical protein [Staphylococcus]|uniref:Lipoprotein n=1 Tax=Staphylococcus equorum TaxID=246432 RepID=A0AAW7AE19_9STAP|nr:hypothetical protein [Staphylococcus equorum]MDK9864842.1 hypothetical protein [Staphylococcus equorum]